MALTPIRINAPVKGWNSISPVREMPQGYAIRAENVWFDQAGGANRRPCQSTFDDGVTALGGTLESLHEHYSILGVSKIFGWSSGGTVFVLSGVAWASSLAAVFSSKPRSAQLGNVLILGDGTAVRSYNGTAWATPAGVSPMSHFCVYNGRMYGTGNPADIGVIYYSNPISATGATDWTTGAGGGFISVYGALSQGEKVIAVEEYQGYLVALCSNSIIMYQGSDPNDPTTFRVVKAVKGIGCYSADSVKKIGNDLIFLSNYGFKTLKEVMVRGDAAAFESSFAINNFVASQVRSGNMTNISATYAEKYGVYLCTFGLDTLAYHVQFDSWASWNGLNETLFTAQDGTTYTANNRLHKLDSNIYADYLDGASVGVAVSWVIEFPPFRTSSAEQKARWNKIEIIFEGTVADTITVTTWLGLNESTASTDVVELNPDVPAAVFNEMLWTATATTNPRNAWGTGTGTMVTSLGSFATLAALTAAHASASAGDYAIVTSTTPSPMYIWDTGTSAWLTGTGPSWSGGEANAANGDAVLPIVGRAELLSVRLENTNKTRFRLTALEVYMNEGGLRK